MANVAFALHSLKLPIVQAPMAGGASTPALAAAVGEAGGLGFLAAGYKPVDAVAQDIAALRAFGDAPFGVNIFAPPADEAPPETVLAYARTLAADAERLDVTLGDPRFDDDAYRAKLDLVVRERVPVVSFTFGCPERDTVAELRSQGIAVWVTVTDLGEAREATDAGADALVAQGTEAGGHRAYFRDDGTHEDYGVLPLVRILRTETELPTRQAPSLDQALFFEVPEIARDLLGKREVADPRPQVTPGMIDVHPRLHAAVRGT